MNLAERNELIKASPAIQVQSKMTLLQRRAWNVLLANAYDELPNTDIYSISVAELAAKLGFNSKNENYLKEILEALVDCKVKWNILGKDKEEEWGVAVLLASANIKDGICTYGFAHISDSNFTTLAFMRTQPTPTKSVQKPICPRFMGSLFRLF